MLLDSLVFLTFLAMEHQKYVKPTLLKVFGGPGLLLSESGEPPSEFSWARTVETRRAQHRNTCITLTIILKSKTMERCRCAFVSDSVVVSVGVGVWSLTKDSFASKIKIRQDVFFMMDMGWLSWLCVAWRGCGFGALLFTPHLAQKFQ